MSSDKTPLGDRMKAQYERRAQSYLPRRTYTIIRLDGKAFHTYTKGLLKPYDLEFQHDMAGAAAVLCSEVQGCALAYVQSDEVSLLVTDFAKDTTDAWFDGNVQKIVSVAASIMSVQFNRRRRERGIDRPAYFDARAFTIPDPTEVGNYLIWRQRDCVRNSILALGQAYFSHKQLNGKKTDEIQEMVYQHTRINWATDVPDSCRNGTLISKYRAGDNPQAFWMPNPAFQFSKQRELLDRHIPVYT